MNQMQFGLALSEANLLTLSSLAKSLHSCIKLLGFSSCNVFKQKLEENLDQTVRDILMFRISGFETTDLLMLDYYEKYPLKLEYVVETLNSSTKVIGVRFNADNLPIEKDACDNNFEVMISQINLVEFGNSVDFDFGMCTEEMLIDPVNLYCQHVNPYSTRPQRKYGAQPAIFDHLFLPVGRMGKTTVPITFFSQLNSLAWVRYNNVTNLPCEPLSPDQRLEELTLVRQTLQPLANKERTDNFPPNDYGGGFNQGQPPYQGGRDPAGRGGEYRGQYQRQDVQNWRGTVPPPQRHSSAPTISQLHQGAQPPAQGPQGGQGDNDYEQVEPPRPVQLVDLTGDVAPTAARSSTMATAEEQLYVDPNNPGIRRQLRKINNRNRQPRQTGQPQTSGAAVIDQTAAAARLAAASTNAAEEENAVAKSALSPQKEKTPTRTESSLTRPAVDTAEERSRQESIRQSSAAQAQSGGGSQSVQLQEVTVRNEEAGRGHNGQPQVPAEAGHFGAAYVPVLPGHQLPPAGAGPGAGGQHLGGFGGGIGAGGGGGAIPNLQGMYGLGNPGQYSVFQPNIIDQLHQMAIISAIGGGLWGANPGNVGNYAPGGGAGIHPETYDEFGDDEFEMGNYREPGPGHTETRQGGAGEGLDNGHGQHDSSQHRGPGGGRGIIPRRGLASTRGQGHQGGLHGMPGGGGGYLHGYLPGPVPTREQYLARRQARAREEAGGQRGRGDGHQDRGGRGGGSGPIGGGSANYDGTSHNNANNNVAVTPESHHRHDSGGGRDNLNNSGDNRGAHPPDTHNTDKDAPDLSSQNIDKTGAKEPGETEEESDDKVEEDPSPAASAASKGRNGSCGQGNSTRRKSSEKEEEGSEAGGVQRRESSQSVISDSLQEKTDRSRDSQENQNRSSLQEDEDKRGEENAADREGHGATRLGTRRKRNTAETGRDDQGIDETRRGDDGRLADIQSVTEIGNRSMDFLEPGVHLARSTQHVPQLGESISPIVPVRLHGAQRLDAPNLGKAGGENPGNEDVHHDEQRGAEAYPEVFRDDEPVYEVIKTGEFDVQFGTNSYINTRIPPFDKRKSILNEISKVEDVSTMGNVFGPSVTNEKNESGRQSPLYHSLFMRMSNEQLYDEVNVIKDEDEKAGIRGVIDSLRSVTETLEEVTEEMKRKRRSIRNREELENTISNLGALKNQLEMTLDTLGNFPNVHTKLYEVLEDWAKRMNELADFEQRREVKFLVDVSHSADVRNIGTILGQKSLAEATAEKRRSLLLPFAGSGSELSYAQLQQTGLLKDIELDERVTSPTAQHTSVRHELSLHDGAASVRNNNTRHYITPHKSALVTACRRDFSSASPLGNVVTPIALHPSLSGLYPPNQLSRAQSTPLLGWEKEGTTEANLDTSHVLSEGEAVNQEHNTTWMSRILHSLVDNIPPAAADSSAESSPRPPKLRARPPGLRETIADQARSSSSSSYRSSKSRSKSSSREPAQTKPEGSVVKIKKKFETLTRGRGGQGVSKQQHTKKH